MSLDGMTGFQESAFTCNVSPDFRLLALFL